MYRCSKRERRNAKKQQDRLENRHDRRCLGKRPDVNRNDDNDENSSPSLKQRVRAVSYPFALLSMI